ncbi:MAG: phosphoribosyltransferase [Thermoprotei archaeon]
MSKSLELRCVVLTWGDIYGLSRKMALHIKQDGFRPDLVVAVSRGGVVPARIACDVLGIMDLLSVKVDHWLQTGDHTEKAVIKYPLSIELTGKRVLVVDDIADTGSSLEVAKNHVLGLGASVVRTATMQTLQTSSFNPDYTGERVSEWAWFIYPWNFYEDLGNLMLRLLRGHPELRGDHKDMAKWFREYYGVRVSGKRLREAASMLSERGYVKWVGKTISLTA